MPFDNNELKRLNVRTDLCCFSVKVMSCHFEWAVCQTGATRQPNVLPPPTLQYK